MFKDYFPFAVITKYWLYSPMLYNTILSLSYTQQFVPPTPLPLYCPSPLLTTNLFSISVSLLLVDKFIYFKNLLKLVNSGECDSQSWGEKRVPNFFVCFIELCNVLIAFSPLYRPILIEFERNS